MSPNRGINTIGSDLRSPRRALQSPVITCAGCALDRDRDRVDSVGLAHARSEYTSGRGLGSSTSDTPDLLAEEDPEMLAAVIRAKLRYPLAP